MIGYCGWVLITKEIGDQWFRGEVGPYGLPAAPADQADAGALTIVRIVEPKLVLPLMRECRKLNPGKRVYIRRDYGDRKKPGRQSYVHA
jgi:hypothetical protein